MNSAVISEPEFCARISFLLKQGFESVGSVTGPGRSGAVAAVYASHILGVPFIPFKATVPQHLGRLLIVDTAMESGATMRKAERFYKDVETVSLVCWHEPPRVMFWYEAGKPQRYRHERVAA
jgi:adenine/guanine phosphoribosyltransferase-like PRPP-binding protein